MNALRVKPEKLTLLMGSLLVTPGVFAQAASGGASTYQEMGWLALALLIGFSVIARRASRHEQDATTPTANVAADEAAQSPAPVRRTLRLIDAANTEQQAEPGETPVLVIQPTPKKTA